MIAASSGSGGISSEAPAQTAPSDLRKRLRRRVAAAGERVDAATLPGGDLRKNVRGGAEAVEAERLRIAPSPAMR